MSIVLVIILLVVIFVILWRFYRKERFDATSTTTTTTKCNNLIGPAASHVFNVTLINGMTAHDLFVQSVNWFIANRVYTQMTSVIKVGPLTITFVQAPVLPQMTSQNVPSIIFESPFETSQVAATDAAKCQITVGVTATFVVPLLQIDGLEPSPVMYNGVNVITKGNLSLLQDPTNPDISILHPQLTSFSLDLTGQPYENLITSALQSVDVVQLITNLFLQSQTLATQGIKVPLPLSVICQGICVLLQRYGCC